MKKYKITESQYNRLLKELEDEKLIYPISHMPDDNISDEENDPLTQEEIQDKKINELTEKIDFIEGFFRDIIDFQEFSTHHIDESFKEISKGEIGIEEVVEKLNLLTARKGRSSFYTAKRGLS